MASTAIGGPTCRRRTISHKKSRSITSQITAPDKNSTYLLSAEAVVLAHQTVSRFQKAIKKVRAVQRMRRNRGFAFSQTENASRQDQARLIRAYDTSKDGARPSGY